MDNFERLSAIQMNELNDLELGRVDGGMLFLVMYAIGIGVALYIALS